jgi:hypothetical protein
VPSSQPERWRTIAWRRQRSFEARLQRSARQCPCITYRASAPVCVGGNPHRASEMTPKGVPRIEKVRDVGSAPLRTGCNRLPGDGPVPKQWLSEIVSAAHNSLWFVQPQRPEIAVWGGNRNHMIAFMFRLMRDKSNTSMGRRRAFATHSWTRSQYRCARHHADRRCRRPGHS